MTMTTVAATHLFGSRDGYRTLASNGINSEEEEQLSGLGFGQSFPGYFEQLLSHPTALGRRLESTGRYAVTRCFPGQEDDAGRMTLRLLSLVFESKAWIECVRGNLNSLLMDPRVWDTTHYAAGRMVELPYLGGQLKASRQDYLLVDHWVSIRKDPLGVIVLPDEENSVDAIMHLAGALAPEDAPYYRWGIRMLSTTFSGINIMTIDSRANTASSKSLHQVKLEHPFNHDGVQNCWKYRNATKKTGLPNLACLTAIGRTIVDTTTEEPAVPTPQVDGLLSWFKKPLLAKYSRNIRIVLCGIIIIELLLLLLLIYKPDLVHRFITESVVTTADDGAGRDNPLFDIQKQKTEQ